MNFYLIYFNLRINWLTRKLNFLYAIKHTSGYSKSEGDRRIAIYEPALSKALFDRLVELDLGPCWTTRAILIGLILCGIAWIW